MLFVSSESFLSDFVPGMADKISENTKAAWGKMSAKDVLKHLILSLRMSRGEYPITPMFDDTKTERSKVFLMSDRKLPRDFYNPIVEQSDRVDLGTTDLKLLIEMLKSELQQFFEYYSNNPEISTRHPVFGLLNFSEWERFHHKHFYHHFLQFGLIDEYKIFRF